MPKKFAVFGNPIEHSLSPQIHADFAKQFDIDLIYEKILVPEDGLSHAIAQFFNQGGSGLNITLPFKTEAFNLANHVTERGRLAKAVNTLWMEEGVLCADNTDGIGLVSDFAHKHITLKDKKVLIVGAGGAVRGILGPLLAEKPKGIWVTNRTAEKLKQLQQDFPDINVGAMTSLSGAFDIIISATPNQTVTLPTSLWHAKTVAYDLAYLKQQDTPFVAFAKSQGLQAYDGLGMLMQQAAHAFYQWHGVMPILSSLPAPVVTSTPIVIPAKAGNHP